MKNRLVILLILGILFLSFIGLQKTTTNSKQSATINGVNFNLEIAQTKEQKSIGLAKYKKIEKNFAMYFPFERKDYYSFWMKDMKFPIDIIYIDNGKIVAIFKNVQNPKSPNDKLQVYNPEKLADSVLEISAGLSDKYNFKTGNRVSIKK